MLMRVALIHFYIAIKVMQNVEKSFMEGFPVNAMQGRILLQQKLMKELWHQCATQEIVMGSYFIFG